MKVQKHLKMKYERKTALAACLLFGSAVGIFTPVVEVEQGRLRGVRSVSGQNRFYGIPYATSKRFKPPEPPTKWEGTFDAVYPFKSCAQIVSFFMFGQEQDCLQLDVYTPEHAKPGNKLPVLVFIHGGAYYYGSKWHYDPEFLVTKNVVAVIVNYRMGIFGFLCLNGISNLGLKDQVAALKWIQRNIAAFGGDPDNVTVSGQSAGASAAAMHMLSKSSAGLFHKAILLSGNPLAPWAFNTETTTATIEDARKIRHVENVQDALEVFSTSTVVQILNSTKDTSLNPRYFKYSPCVDTNFTDPFFHDTPFKTITSGNFNKVPIISGFASLEGTLFYGLHDDKSLKEWDENFTEKLPSVFSWCSANKELITEKFRARYFSEEISKASMRGVVNFYSDWEAYATTDAFSNLITKHSDQPIFNYIFSYEGDRNFAKSIFGGGSKLVGASHSDDLFYIFKPGGLPLLLSSPDKLFINRVTAMLTNFMKFGDPTPKLSPLHPVRWPASTTNRSRSMVLGKTLQVVDTPASLKGQFFLDLLCQYGQEGYVPCESQMKCATRK